ncbi:MAG: MFS transporter, partial [bacterium]|nr:MFS transporter [bacterium]
MLSRLSSMRYLVVFSLFALSMINYIDRAAISSAKKGIASDLALSDQAMGWVFGAFALGYALAQVPSGWLADRMGPRLALTVVAAIWSLFTGFTGLAGSLAVLLVVRFLFGIAEAGSFPGSARAIYNWLPVAERGRANGILMSGSRIGAGVAFLLMPWLIGRFEWRGTFYLLAIPGAVWAILWAVFFRNHPRRPVEQTPAGAAPQHTFGEVLRSPAMLLNVTQYFAGNFTFFICLSWLNDYFQRQHGLSPEQAGVYSMIPLLCGGLAQWVSGFVVDALYHSGFQAWSRRFPAMLGFTLAAVGILVAGLMEDPLWAVVWFAIATFGADMTITPSWVY